MRRNPARQAFSGAERIIHHVLWLYLRPSFVPPAWQRELRELTRYRASLVEERSRLINRLQKVLEDTNIKLASV